MVKDSASLAQFQTQFDVYSVIFYFIYLFNSLLRGTSTTNLGVITPSIEVTKGTSPSPPKEGTTRVTFVFLLISKATYAFHVVKERSVLNCLNDGPEKN